MKREGKSGKEKEEKKEEVEVGKRRMSKEEDEEKWEKLKEDEDVICLVRKDFCVVLSKEKENNVLCHCFVDEEEEVFVDEEVVESEISRRGGGKRGELVH